ncbi:MAG: GHKL domain-containing protein, partial [Cyclobacteriaceae bacterium]|nr:GHKL domain-containing protein [Cyclobacteriaceae bacterium]
HMKGKALREFEAHRKEENHFPDPLIEESSELGYCFLSIGEGGLGITRYKAIKEEELNLFKRFHMVFSLAYQRFIDIQKAEAQAREAQIEVALERARTQSMLMQHSDEIKTISNTFHQQLLELGIPSEFSYVWLPDESNQEHQFWASWSETENGKTLFKSKQITYPLDKSEPYTKACFDAWAQPEIILEEFIAPDQVEGFFEVWKELLDGAKKLKAELFPEGIFYSEAYMRYGCFGINIRRKLTEEEKTILKRFSTEFERAYTRFLDLKKAEEQARNAQIEAALERVRARSMAMHSSSELADTALVVFQELNKLGIDSVRVGIALVDLDQGQAELWLVTEKDGKAETKILGKANSEQHEFYKNYIEAARQKKDYFFAEMEGKELKEYYEVATKALNVPKPEVFPDREFYYSFFFNEGSINIIARQELNPEEQTIGLRFAKVFGLIYRRFLDLQKAEAQAREAEIESSLDRIRARTMAMQSSDELLPTSAFILKELRGLGQGDDQSLLGVSLIDEEKNQFISYISDSGGPVIRDQMALPLNHHPFIHELYNAWKKAKENNSAPQFLSRTLSKEKFEEWVNQLILYNKGEHPDAFVPDEVLKLTQLNLPQWTFEDAFYKQGILFYQNINPISDEFRDILVRFAKVFEQTYTRFLDLQKAEAQAREARINLAVERVRSHAMAMQSTSDLLDVVVTLRTEFINLGHEAHYFWHMLWKTDKYEKAMTSGDGTRIGFVMELPRSIHSEIPLIDEWEKGNAPTVIYPMNVDAAIDYVHKMVSLGDFKRIDPQAPTDDDIRHIGGLTFIMARTTHGEIGYSLPGPVTDPPQEALDILVRFAGAFDLAHRRFLDLQLSEAQARETQIELSLERIRGQVTSMRESSDLFDIVVSMRKEFVSLGHEADYFWHMSWLPDSYEMSMTSEDGNRIGMVISLPKLVHEEFPDLIKWENGKKPTYIMALDADEAWAYLESMNTYGHYEQADPNAPSQEDIQQLGGLTFILARTSHGEIGFSLAGKVSDPPQESIDTLVRFAGVFDLAYKRFEDLKKAEARIREEKVKTALERVRSRSLAMHQSTELQDVIKTVSDQFKELEIDISGGAFIVINKDLEEGFYCWGAGGVGNYIRKVMVPFIDLPIYTTLSNGIKNREPFFTELYDVQEKHTFFRHLFNHEQFINTPIQRQEYLLSLFSGYARSCVVSDNTSIFIINHEGRPFSEEENEFLKQMGRVFEQAYTRFVDLEKAELQARLISEERDRLEIALNELKTTQAQLIQQEKLASLGQLTAGIAHEIKNPLNFVNNFSDLSKELIEEVFEELENLENSEAKEEIISILEDVRSNLTKVHEHGSRADRIVKSMLQHSRASESKRAPQPFNSLVKEFVNLSFHGMRASKSPINVDIALDLDPQIGEVSLISEDFSRVILNLCNNAFDAIRDKIQTSSPDYHPKLTIKSTMKKGQVLLSIGDNGPGIPDEIKDKILQPFFTTKKGTEGTGLGLSITHDIIKAHGGELNINTEIGKGTAFLIQLPQS